MIEGSTEGQNMTQKKALFFINPSAGITSSAFLYCMGQNSKPAGFWVVFLNQYFPYTSSVSNMASRFSGFAFSRDPSKSKM